MQTRLFIVIPCYNEHEVLPLTANSLSKKISSLISDGIISETSRILFVDDGSSDATWDLISQLHEQNTVFQGLQLSRNRGHQNALFAGLMTVRKLCDACISLDADLQDDVDVIDEMLEKYHNGCDIVYGVRSGRKKDSLFKRATAQSFYKLMNSMGAQTVYNHADFRLMSRRALEGLSAFPEVNLFLRGLIPLIGFNSDIVTYERGQRTAGESKYPLKKMLQFAMEGITSFSIQPIRLIASFGFLIFFASIIVLIYSLIGYAMGNTIPGWTTTVLSVWAIGGLIMISLGVIGEYIGKIYLESKHRPRYIIDTYLGDTSDYPNLNDTQN